MMATCRRFTPLDAELEMLKVFEPFLEQLHSFQLIQQGLCLLNLVIDGVFGRKVVLLTEMTLQPRQVDLFLMLLILQLDHLVQQGSLGPEGIYYDELEVRAVNGHRVRMTGGSG